MKIIFLIINCLLCVNVYCQDSSMALSLNKQHARKAPEWITNGIIYQIQPRAFTPEGTLKAATTRLKNVADIGASIIYLCPVFVADDNDDQSTWSPRQKASKMNNSRNPYRMMDYYHVDPEYGTDEDLKTFIRECHRLGMKIMLDMVYLHCGTKAVFLKDHPDFVKHDKEGGVIKAAWNWPALNYENDQLKEYLWQNMEYWLKEFDVDGFRCDVSDGVPLDFWEIARKRLEIIKPDIGMLGEGSRKEDQIEAFDINYNFEWFNTLRAVYEGKKSVLELRETWEKMANERPLGARTIRYTDTHDIANDAYDNRVEKTWGLLGVNAAMVMSFTIDGVPFIYNGQEVADNARHSIFGRLPIDWANGDRFQGKKRYSFCQKLCDLRHKENTLRHGSIEWVENNSPNEVLSYFRTLKGERILTVVNLTNKPVDVKLLNFIDVKGKSTKILLSEGSKGDISKGFKLPVYGYWVGKFNQ